MTEQELKDRCKALCEELRVNTSGEGYDNRVASLIFFLSLLRPNKVLEIGSHKGITTEALCLFCNHVTAVDPWYSDLNGLEVFTDRKIFQGFQKRMEPYRDKLEIHVGKSPETLFKMPANTFDMCYIDGAHDFESVKKDFVECQRLVKPYGLICGHDYGSIPAVTAAVICTTGRQPDMLLPDTTYVYCNSFE